MKDVKTTITQLLLSTNREGMAQFVEEMEQAGFFTAPCSGGNHLCKEGGLAEHSLNVYEQAVKLMKAYRVDDVNSVIISTLLHDYGKVGDYQKNFYVPNVLKTGKVSDSKPYKRNPAMLEKSHAVKSIALINRWIDLTEDEEYAILHHDGLYDRANYEAFQGNETKLLLLVHYADLFCCRFVDDVKGE